MWTHRQNNQYMLLPDRRFQVKVFFRAEGILLCSVPQRVGATPHLAFPCPPAHPPIAFVLQVGELLDLFPTTEIGDPELSFADFTDAMNHSPRLLQSFLPMVLLTLDRVVA